MKFFVLINFCFLLIACNPQPVGNQKEVAEEIKDREIIRVTKAEILDEAGKKGELIANAAQNSLSEILGVRIRDAGIGGAVRYCNMAALPTVDSLSKLYSADIKRVSLKVRNPMDEPDQIEREILEAYEYAKQNSLTLESNVQELEDQTVLYTRPILISNSMCLSCHGTLGEELSEQDHQTIMDLYPHDSATDYKMGDLRGMWSIRFQKKELIKSMSN